MSLDRKLIREAWVSVIRGTNTIAGKNVVSNRITKNWQENLPAVNVYPISEAGNEIHNESPLSFKRNLQMRVECLVSARNEEEASERLDQLMDQVEQAIGSRLSFDPEFRCLMDEVFPLSVDFEFEENGRDVVGAGAITYNVRYYSDATRDEASLVDLQKMSATYSVGSDSENEQDVTDVPTL